MNHFREQDYPRFAKIAGKNTKFKAFNAIFDSSKGFEVYADK